MWLGQDWNSDVSGSIQVLSMFTVHRGLKDDSARCLPHR